MTPLKSFDLVWENFVKYRKHSTHQDEIELELQKENFIDFYTFLKRDEDI